MTEPGTLVSNRNHFSGSEHYAELLLMLANQYKFEKISPDDFLIQANGIVGHVIDGCVWDFSTAARNGMEQAAKLKRSPRYNTLLKDRRRRMLLRQAEFNERMKQERKERRLKKFFDADGAEKRPVQ